MNNEEQEKKQTTFKPLGHLLGCRELLQMLLDGIDLDGDYGGDNEIITRMTAQSNTQLGRIGL